MRRITGNRVELLEVAADEAAGKLRSRKQLWNDMQREGILILGSSVEDLQGRRSA